MEGAFQHALPRLERRRLAYDRVLVDAAWRSSGERGADHGSWR